MPEFVINPMGDDLIPLPRAPKKLPNAPSYETLLRYHREGKISKLTGVRCYLAVVQIGSSYYTSAAAWSYFLNQLNGRTDDARANR